MYPKNCQLASVQNTVTPQDSTDTDSAKLETRSATFHFATAKVPASQLGKPKSLEPEVINPFTVGINTKVIGKCDPDKLSYAGAFKAEPFDSLAALLGHHAKGHPWMPGLLGGTGKRWQSNVVGADVLAVDIDGGMTIQQALDNSYIAQHCGGGAESSSSTPENHKYRLIFRLPDSIRSDENGNCLAHPQFQAHQLIRICNRYLIDLVGAADPACKDASRFFFGGLGREPFWLNESATLPASFIDDALAWYQVEENKAQAQRAIRAKQAEHWLAEHGKEAQIELVQSALDALAPYTPNEGRYGDLSVAIAGLCNDLGTVGEQLAIAWDAGRGQWGRPFEKWLKSLLRSNSGTAGLGSLFWLAKQEGWKRPAKIKRTKFKSSALNTAKALSYKEQLKADWLRDMAQVAGLPAGVKPSRKAINDALMAQQLVQSEAVEGCYEPLSLAERNTRKLYLLNGQKGTRKTSVANDSLIKTAKLAGLSTLVVVPSRQLSRNGASELGLTYHLDPSASHSNAVITCPESLYKFRERPWDLVILDEVNEDLLRTFEGQLGNAPELCRQGLASILKGASTVVLSTDQMLKASVKAVMRMGGFVPSEVETIARRRPPSDMTIELYRDMSAAEAPGGSGIKGKQVLNEDYYGWMAMIVERIESGEKVAIPIGSQEKARALDRILRARFDGKDGRAKKRGQCIDGQFTPSALKKAFADGPDSWIEQNQPDWLIWTPVFNSGVSIDSDYFDIQFEAMGVFEPASAASQRGERLRALLSDRLGERALTERHIYISNRGLPSMPDPQIFTAEYWQTLAIATAEAKATGSDQQVTLALGATAVLERHKGKLVAEATQNPELYEFLAVQAREIYFKEETLRAEWASNGWNVIDSQDISGAQEMREWALAAKESVLQSKSRALSKARPVETDSEDLSPLEVIRGQKYQLGIQLGHDWEELKNSDWLAAWVVADGGNGLKAQRVQALARLSITQPALWADIVKLNTVRAIASAAELKSLPDLNISSREIELAQALLNCPGIQSVLRGDLVGWNNRMQTLKDAAAYVRQNAGLFARLSSHQQRIYGYQFTPTTPIIKCFHKVLEMLDLKATSDGRDGQLWQYRLKQTPDIKVNLDDLSKGRRDRTVSDFMASNLDYERLREKYRLETAGQLQARLSERINGHINRVLPEWAKISESLMKQSDAELQLTNAHNTEVLHRPDSLADSLAFIRQNCMTYIQYQSYHSLLPDDLAQQVAMLLPKDLFERFAISA